MNLYWTGARASDTKYTDTLFKGSITIYGDNKNDNVSYCFGRKRINHNVFCPESSAFILKSQLELIERQPDCLFMAYNPNYVYGAPNNVLERTLCLNDERLMKRLDNKVEFRNVAKDVIRMLDYDVFSGKDLSSNTHLKELILRGVRIVMQTPVSSGGEGTILIDASNIDILCNINENEDFLISRYIEDNIPINAHCVVYNDYSIILPPSIQVIANEGSRLLYRGADYISYEDVPDYAKREFVKQLELICEKLRKMGYRGVVGFDGIVCRDNVYILEANNRFQGSTYALNCALWHNGLPSLQQMNLEAFDLVERSGKSLDKVSVSVPYSYFVFLNDFSGIHARHIMENAYRSNLVLEHSCDGFEPGQAAEKNAYLYHLLFDTNICSIDSESLRTTLHPALESPPAQWYSLLREKKDFSAIKTSLINQGIILSDEANRHLAWECGFREGEYFSVDLLLKNLYYVNCPVGIKFANLSPFVLEYEKDTGLSVSYYGNMLLDKVDFIPKPILNKWITSSGKPLCDMAFFSTDRLRLQNSPTCVFNKTKQTCRFCEVCDWDLDFNEKDIFETIDSCFSFQPIPFRHILIGGRSNAIGSEKQTILNMCSRIKGYADIPIYLMCLPPINLSDIKEYFDAGVTEFGFNIEIFDRNIAKKIMPGKGRIPIKQYLDALEYAGKLCGRTGEVRSAFVVGLEPMETLLKGIEAVCKVGAAPILSAFRPINATPMQDVVPLSSANLMQVACAAEAICKRYGLSLGPQCAACQNNTLNII